MKGPKIIISCNECEHFSNFDKTCRHPENIHQTSKILETPIWCPFDLFKIIKNKIEDIKKDRFIKAEEIIRKTLGENVAVNIDEYDQSDIIIYYGSSSIGFGYLSTVQKDLKNAGYEFSIEIGLDEENDLKATLNNILV